MPTCRVAITALLVVLAGTAQATAQQSDRTGAGAPPADTGPAGAKKKTPAAQAAPGKPPDAATPDSAPLKPDAGGPAASPVAIPPPEVLLMLVRTTLVALNQANYTANYSVLYGLGTPALRARNTPETLAAAFKALREAKVDLSPVLVLTPQLSEPPSLGAEGVMSLKGFFPTRPLQVNFAMAFQPVDGRWLIDGLSVATVPVAAAAATPQAAPVPPAVSP